MKRKKNDQSTGEEEKKKCSEYSLISNIHHIKNREEKEKKNI
jgi:hypothetical protein